MIERKRIISLNEVQVVIFLQNRKHKRTLDKLSHFRNGLYVEGFLLLQELHSYVAVRLDWSIRQRHLLA